jgi:hypothetical protein
VTPSIWRQIPIPAAHDIRSLLPPSLPRRFRFETLRDAKQRDLSRIETLENYDSSLALALEECDQPNSPCDLPICTICARQYRRYFTSQALSIAKSIRGPREFATVYLDSIDADLLPDVSVRRAHDTLRTRLNRSGFRGSVLIGGTEAAWIARDRCWILHVHVLAIGVQGDSWDRLRQRLDYSGSGAALKVERLTDLPRQISYLTKFTTYHRPLKRGPTGVSRCFPLPPRRLEELASWWANYSFEDFAFLYGARRRGGRIVLEG